MDTPGKLLKTVREGKGKSLEEISNLLKIRHEYLKAIEAEDYQLIPGEVFVKGYIRAYASAFGLDSDYILGLYKKQTAIPKTPEQPPVKKNPFIYKPYWIPLAFVLAILLLVLFVQHKKQGTVDEIKALSALLEESKTLSLEISATEKTWLSISVDKGKPEQRFLNPEEVRKWTASEGFFIKIGNAGGVRVIFNGRDIGDLGPHGKVVRLVLPEDAVSDKSEIRAEPE